MAKQTGTVRPGTTLKAQIGERIRHVVVESVTDQDNIEVRLGGASLEGSSRGVSVSRESSTKTRGTLFSDA